MPPTDTEVEATTPDTTTAEPAPVEEDAPPSRGASRSPLASPDVRFWLGTAGAVCVGAVIRLVYLFHAAPVFVLGDGLFYTVGAHRLADGLGYTDQAGGELAHHPPGWHTVLWGVTEVGWGSMRAHQVTGIVFGLGVIVLAGLVGRRYVSRRAGVVAALLAATYPGFWVLDVQILSEPLGLVVLGVLMLVVADLWERPTLGRAAATGVVAGVLALVRSEQAALLVLVVAPVLLLNGRLGTRRRIAGVALAGVAALLVIAPWARHNLARFEEPVVLSTNGGSTLLAGNCPPATYGGDLIGSNDGTCVFRLASTEHYIDRSQADAGERAAALDNMRDNIDRLPATVMARHGRVLGLFRPSQTVDIAASWLGSAHWPVWAWVASFWVLAPLAVYGSVLLRRTRTFQWPLLAPLAIVLVVVTVTYGEPRYHTMADLGVVVLAAVALERVTRRIPLWRQR
jgi:4-amino-4-deoxy-L-arabinose transferase-like glycosyltransferase